jgi:NitT/TauT family transport system substrate-binding protein
MMNRRTATLTVGSALVGLALPARAQSGLVPLKLITSPDDDATPVLYAQQAGLFRAAGLDVTVTAANSGAAVALAVVSGAADIGKSSLLSIITAHARGLPLIIVAPAGEYVSPRLIAAMVVARDSAVRTAADLSGRTIAVPALNDLGWVTTKLWIDENGGTSAAARFVEIPSAAAGAALDAGRIDAGTIIDPTLTSDLATGRYRVLANTLEAVAKRFLFSGWFANADRMNATSEPYARFARVLRNAAAYANAHHDQTVPMLAAFTGIEPQVIVKMNRATYGSTLTRIDVQPLIDAAARYGVIPSAFNGSAIIATL